jgi:hypothetical protein
MTATNERELKEKSPDVPKAVERGLKERLAESPEGVKRELAEQATREVAAFGAETAGLATRAEKTAGALDAETSSAVKGTETEAHQAAGELAKDLGMEKREVPVSYEVIGYFDDKGEQICTIVIGTEQEFQHTEAVKKLAGEPGENQVKIKLRSRTRSIVIREMEGQRREMDILKDKDLELGDINIHFTSASEERKVCSFIRRANVVITTAPENPVQFGILGHELGHGKQYREGEFREIAQHSDAAKNLRRADKPRWEEARPVIESLYRSFPEVRERLDNGMFEAMDSLTAQDASLSSELIKAEAQQEVRMRYNRPDEAHEAGERAASLRAELAQVILTMERLDERVKSVAYLVVKILEMDATRRALEMFKIIKEKTGVDFGRSTLIPKNEAGRADEDCEDSLNDENNSELIKMDAKTRLARALATYGVPTKKAA